MLRVQGTAAERINRIPIEHVGQIFVIPYFNLLNLVGCPEAVEEMEERHAALNGARCATAPRSITSCGLLEQSIA